MSPALPSEPESSFTIAHEEIVEVPDGAPQSTIAQEAVSSAPHPDMASLQTIRKTLEAVAMILAPKALFLLGMVGAFILTLFAMYSGTWFSLAALACYGIMVFVPLALFPKG